MKTILELTPLARRMQGAESRSNGGEQSTASLQDYIFILRSMRLEHVSELETLTDADHDKFMEEPQELSPAWREFMNLWQFMEEVNYSIQVGPKNETLALFASNKCDKMKSPYGSEDSWSLIFLCMPLTKADVEALQKIATIQDDNILWDFFDNSGEGGIENYEETLAQVAPGWNHHNFQGRLNKTIFELKQLPEDHPFKWFRG